jgi:hypothetical protein
VTVVAAPASAQQGGGDDSGVASAQARADQAANSYFDALTRSLELQAEIAHIEQSILGFEQQVAELRNRARGRAVEAYKRSGTPVIVQLSNRVAAMDNTRRSVLLDTLNARDDNVAAQLTEARDRLDGRRQELKVAKQQQDDLVNRLRENEQRGRLCATSGRAPAAQPPVDGLHTPHREQRQLPRLQRVGPVLRRLPVHAEHVELDSQPLRPG